MKCKKTMPCLSLDTTPNSGCGISFGPVPGKPIMKRLFFFCTGALSTFLFFGCNGGTSDNVKNAKDSNATKIDSQTAVGRTTDSSAALLKSDADFLVDAA